MSTENASNPLLSETPVPSAQEIAEKAARQIAENTDAASKAAKGPRFCFREYVDEQKAVILSAITAAGAQAKEDDTARLDWLEEHDYDWRELEFSDQGLRFAIDSARSSRALELKEPATDNVNAFLRKALEDLTCHAYGSTGSHYCPNCDNSLFSVKADIERFLSEHSNAAGAAQVFSESDVLIKRTNPTL